ncbi:MAG TPA: OmcA/MtrC family decaheme c-type cytochrome [Caldimonas sp.]|jgi:OmcA/MtrC family decaheme c-type cytochrome
MGKQRIAHWLAASVAALLAASLVACGGGDSNPAGPAGPSGPSGPPGNPGTPGTPGNPGTGGTTNVGSNTLTDPSAITANAAAWADLRPTVTITNVTIASPPVVSFTVFDNFGKAVVGLGNTSQSSTATVANYPNLSFALAKLVPGEAGGPSKWVSYIVTTVPSTTTAAAPQRPGTDNTGTLVDNGDGSYKYTFYRDITTIKSQIAGMTVNPPNSTADLGDLTYNPALTHRVAIALSGSAPATGSNTPTGATSSVASVSMTHPANAIYDFIPATGAQAGAGDFSREIVAVDNCEACHRQLGGVPGLSDADTAAGFHGGSRNETQYCVVCHTDQRRYGQTEATFTVNGAIRTFTSETRLVDGRTVGNFPNYIHKIHMGPLLVHQSYDYAGVLPNVTTYPQDVRNCTSCHDGSSTSQSTTKTKDGDHWKTSPSALACGACHDGINFATGTGVTVKDKAAGLTTSNINGTGLAHPAGPQADDSACALCHRSNGSFADADIDLAHLPVTPPNPGNALAVDAGNANTNSAWIASGASVGRVPAGAIAPTYDVQSVSRNASKQPVIVFRWLQNGTPVPINAFATAAINPATGQKEMWDNFMGSPSAQFVFAVPQDGIAQPADFNASASGYLRKIWDGTATGSGAGTLTGPDAGGFYTVTLTGVTVPDGAVMLTGGMGYSYSITKTLPLTQTNLAAFPVTAATATGQTNKQGGLIVIAPNVQTVATGYTGRRAIVEDKRCNACHQELGVFTLDSFHGGQRNDATTCSWCHNPNKTSEGWTIDSTAMVHAIHSAAKRQNHYTYNAVSPTDGFFNVTYPGILSDCQTCHLPGTFDFSATPPAALDNRLFRTAGQGTYAASFANSPYVTIGVPYGNGFSFDATTGTTTPAAASTLVISPTATTCSACHDSTSAISHMQTNGGAFYQSRGTAIGGTTESCLVCHGTGRIADIAVVHATN